MNDVFAESGDRRTVGCATRRGNISTALERLHREMKQKHIVCADSAGTKSGRVLPQSRLRAFVILLSTLVIALPTFGMAASERIDECLVREGKKPIINKEDTFLYERALFLTPDEVARYVFLTNRYDDGDRSAAVYRAGHKKGSLAGDYWLTATVAADSVRGDHRNVRVRRYDAPLPASTANVLHKLWLAVLEHSQKGEEAIPCAPTGVLSVTTVGGARLKGITVSLDKNSVCDTSLNLGESLIEYAKLPAPKRSKAAAEIEKQARHLLQR